MKTVNVRICLGTTCFVMGGGQLQNLVDLLQERYGERVSVAGERCFEICSNADSFAKAPFVMVDDELISSATQEKVIEAVERKLQ
jgi:NADH:ubiquinone oxidoreductase subunit E